MKSSRKAYLFWVIGLFGVLGLHRFYMGKYGTGVFWLLSGGVFGFGSLFDLFTIPSQVEQMNIKEELKTIRANALKGK